MMWDDYLGDWVGGGDTGWDDWAGDFAWDFGGSVGGPSFDFNWDDFYGGITSGLDLSGASFGDMLDWYSTPMFDFGAGAVDISSLFAPGYEGIVPTFGPDGDLIFGTPGGQVTYMPGGTIQTSWDDGGTQFYTSNAGRNYFIDYADPTSMGNLVEIFGQAAGAEGPTRYSAYSGIGDDAKYVDYSDVFSPTGGRVTTTSDGRTVVYEDGKAMVPGAGAGTNQENIERQKVYQQMVEQERLKQLVQEATKKPGALDSLAKMLGTNTKDMALLTALLGGLMGLLSKPESKGPVGYQGGIPKYTATRGQAQAPTTGGRVPGGAGIPSLTGGVSYQRAAQGGLMGLASGGQPNPPRYLRGDSDGMADDIYTDIDGVQPARLSSGEYVVSADVVSHLGNGNSDAGAKELDEMMDRIRHARTGTKRQGKEINPRKHLPA